MTARASNPNAPSTTTGDLAPGLDFSQDQLAGPPAAHEPDCDCDDCDCPICDPGCC